MDTSGLRMVIYVNPDELLDNVIFKYNIDSCYPRYREMRNAEELIKKLIAGWNDNIQVACIIAVLPAGEGRNEGRNRFDKIVSFKNVRVKYFECVKNLKPTGYDDIYDCNVLLNIEKEYLMLE